MSYTKVKISDKIIMLNSECPKCGTSNTSTIEASIFDVGKIEVKCLGCRRTYKAGIFSSKWGSAAQW